MKKGEKGILIAIAVIVVLFAGINIYRHAADPAPDKGIPFYSTAPKEMQNTASALMRQLKCRECHVLWAVRDATQAVPAPSLDGMGSLHDEAWLFAYLSSKKPQEILPSRLKAEYRMPSYAHLSEAERHTLASYLASLKVQDWYLAETRKSEYEKLTGQEYKPELEQAQ
ncbi:MAG: cytochrome c [Gammaproteobacteria bacterium]|nr:cytochrome c [Gammaproteobacteria bacterium]